MTVASLPDKRYYMVLSSALADGTNRAAAVRRLGNGSVDTGSNYSSRRNDNGSLVSTNVNVTVPAIVNLSSDKTPQFAVDYVSNLSSKEKLGITHLILQNTAGASTAPQRAEAVWKWANTSNPLNYYEITREPTESGDWEAGSEVVVLGWDPTDTHTTNFWEELASVELSSSGDTLSSGTITAKKYLWVQSFTKGTGGATRSSYTMNSDGGNNYGYRYSVDGATDATGAGQANLYFNSNTTGNTLTNSFIINNSANEKLVISHTVKATSTGASTAPSREENVGKWSNTSSQITSIQMLNSGAGSFDTGSFIKVWGSN